MTRSIRKLLQSLTIEHLWALAVMVGVFAFVNTHPIRPHDFWWHMAIGRQIIQTGAIPTVDVYSLTQSGQPYLSYQAFWLADILLFLIYNLGGAILIVLAQTTLITVTYSLLLGLGWRLTHHLRAAAFGTLFAAVLGFDNWNVRPQTFTYLLGTLILVGIYEYRRTGKKAWMTVFPLAMLFWANIHGSFPIGLALLGLWLVDESFKALNMSDAKSLLQRFKPAAPAGAALALGGLACLFNPRGLGLLSYLSVMANNQVVQQYATEWAPSTFGSLAGSIFLVGLMGMAVVLAVSPKRPGLFQLLCFLVLGVLGLKYTRGIVWFGVGMAPVLSDHLAAILTRLGFRTPNSTPTPGMQRINTLFASLLLFLALLSLPWFKDYLPLSSQKAGLISSETPVEATQFLLANHLSGNLFHDMPFGSYLIWAAQPEYPVFVDSRLELYPLQIWNDYLTISSGSYSWEDLLRKYHFQTLMLSKQNQAGLIRELQNSDSWISVYEDANVVLYTQERVNSITGGVFISRRSR